LVKERKKEESSCLKSIFVFEELDAFFVGIKDSPVSYGGLRRNLLKL
jgi:hypothetical protein